MNSEKKRTYHTVTTALPKMMLNQTEPLKWSHLKKAATVQLTNVRQPQKATIKYRLWELDTPVAYPFQQLQKTVADRACLNIGVDRHQVTLPVCWLENNGNICLWQNVHQKHLKLVNQGIQKMWRMAASDYHWLQNLKNTQCLVVVCPKQDECAVTLNLKLTQKHQFVRVLILTRDHQMVKIYEKLSSQHTNTANVVVDIVVSADTTVNYWCCDQLAVQCNASITRQAWVGRDGRFQLEAGLLSSGNSLQNLVAFLAQRGASATIKAICVSNQKTTGVFARTVSLAEHTTGKISQRGVGLKKANIIFNSVGQINHNAHHASANQENRLLMMSPQAMGEANPILLIDDNQVSAGHAASVGQMDKNLMFYLESRGLSKPQAQRMLIISFLSSVMATITQPQLKRSIEQTIKARLIDEEVK